MRVLDRDSVMITGNGMVLSRVQTDEAFPRLSLVTLKIVDDV